MITSFNPENKVQLDLYTKLFSEAYAELKEAKVENLPERGYFATLDEYFAHMGDIINLDDPSRYILLPLDETSEGIFTINANDRTISIPSQFSKCGAVQNDEKCEIAVFTIDRYFDFQDLDLTQICVQWVNAAGEEGISHIKYRDLKTYPNKLRFGWPLTSNITKKDGLVQFAIRFYKRDEEDKVAYILNTLPATLTVKKSLNVVKPIIEEDVTSLFHKFIENSQNPAYELAKNPFFVKPGKDVVVSNLSETGFGAIDENNELSFSAQAVANDLGSISYEWKYKALDNEGNFADPVILTDGVDYEVIEQNPVEVVRDENGKIVRQGCQKYYTKDAEGALIPYFDDEFPESETFYTVDTVLKINNTSKENIVGKYYVEATNTLGENHSQAISSSEILVPAPQTIVIKKDIPQHIFIEKADSGVQLSIEVEKDANGPKVECEWFGLTDGTNEPSSADDIDTSVGKGWSKNITAPGWYTTIVTSTLNRKVRSTNEEDSAPRKVCKVTNLPAAPVSQEFSYKIANGEWVTVADGDGDSLLDIIPADEIGLGTNVSFKISTDLDDTENKLISEKLEYLWYVQEPEKSTPRLLTESDIDNDNNGLVISGLNTNTLTVQCISNGSIYNYYCVIKNHIQDKSAELDTSKIYTFTIA